MQNTPFNVWQNISGSGMLTTIYVCIVIFLFYKEKEQYKRILLIYLPAFWIIILMLPITYKVIAEVIDEELYYRFFWMLPMTVTIAYGFVQIYHMFSEKKKKFAAAVIILTILVSGDFVYNNWRYSKAETIYHIPKKVVDMCDIMHSEGREVMAVFPSELMQYVRQYDSTICMPYGRNVLVPDWNINHPLYDLMESEVIDADTLGSEAAAYNCSYIVLHEDKKVAGDLTEYGYQLKSACQEYLVYYNHEVFMSIYK